MGFFSTLAKVGGLAAAPFTGGASIPIGLGIGGALDAGSQQGKANQITDEQLEAARRDMAARQPFRDQLLTSLQNPAQRQDLSSLFAGSQNPFARNLGPLNPQAAAPPQSAPIGPPGDLGRGRLRLEDENVRQFGGVN